MKNILVINPPNKPFTNKYILAEPLDVLAIATLIKKGFNKVQVLDMDALRMDNDINSFLSKENLNVLIFVYDYQIPLHKPETLENIFEIIKTCKIKVKTIVVGKTPSHYHKLLIENNIDIVMEGYVENRITDVIDYIENETKLKTIPGLYYKAIYTGKDTRYYDYINCPMVDRSLVNQNNYMKTKTIITSRGCNGKCNFCTTPFFFGKWSAKNSVQVVDELIYIVETTKTNQILFLDDNFTVDKKRVIEICEEIIIRKLNIKFGCLSSIKNYDEDMFNLMYKAGFRWIHFGIESGSKRILKEMNKPMERRKVKQIVKTLKKIGFRIRTSFILDYPTQTEIELIDTLNLINELETDEIRLHFLSRRVGTPLFNKDKNIKEQYIHVSKSQNLNSSSNKLIEKLLQNLENKEYKIIKNDINWKNVNPKKMVSFSPMKYGVNWND